MYSHSAPLYFVSCEYPFILSFRVQTPQHALRQLPP